MKKNTMIKLLKAVGLLLLLLFAVGCVSTKVVEPSITLVDLPATNTDGAIDIQPFKTYTHAIDFGTNAPAVINGVAFDQGPTENMGDIFEGVSSQGYGYIIDDSRRPDFFRIKPHKGNDPGVDGASADMLRDMIYHSNAQESINESIIITLLDLVPGTVYSARYYYRQWDAEKPRPLIITSDCGEIAVDIDDPGAHYVDCTFTASSSEMSITFMYLEHNQGAHIYGLTCEVLSK